MLIFFFLGNKNFINQNICKYTGSIPTEHYGSAIYNMFIVANEQYVKDKLCYLQYDLH